MVLHVDFEHLAEEAKRHGLKPWAYVSSEASQRVVTIGDPASHVVIQAESDMPYTQVAAALTEQGLLVAHGRWLPDPLAGELQIQEQTWVAAVAYKSVEEKPGLWVHGYRGEPSVGDVLRDFYEEMSAESGLNQMPLDEFLSAVEPNVVVLSPDELAAYAEGHV